MAAKTPFDIGYEVALRGVVWLLDAAGKLTVSVDWQGQA
jgi:hypothetical protein